MSNWNIFGHLGQPRVVEMVGLSGGRVSTASGTVIAVERYSTGNFSNAFVTANDFNLNRLVAAADPKMRSVVQVMLSFLARRFRPRNALKSSMA